MTIEVNYIKQEQDINVRVNGWCNHAEAEHDVIEVAYREDDSRTVDAMICPCGAWQLVTLEGDLVWQNEVQR